MTFLAVNGTTSPSIEVSFDYQNDPTSASTAWTDITPYVVSYSRQPVRTNEFDQPGPTGGSLVLRNDDARFTSDNTSGPYTGGLLKYRRVRVRAQWLGVTYNRYFGYILDWPQTWGQAGKDATVTLPLIDNLITLETADIYWYWQVPPTPPALLPGASFASQLSGQAIQDILSAIVRTPDTPLAAALDTGQSTIPASGVLSEPTYALQRIHDIAATEGGVVYAAGDGTITFHDRGHRFSAARSTTRQATIGEAPYEIPYADNVAPLLGDAWTAVSVTPSGGSPVVAHDDIAHNHYFEHILTYPPSGTYLVTSPIEAQGVAGYILGRFSTPITHIPNVELIGAADLSTWPQILGLDTSDRVLFKRRPTGSSALTYSMFVEGYGDTVKVGSDWRVTAYLSPADTQTYWVLGNSQFSLLGQTTRLFY
jgi:hypothetical protein